MKKHIRHIILLLYIAFIGNSVFAVCNANFDFIEISPLDVEFLNISENFNEGNVHYYWDFGDGSNSFEENPNHIYDAAGIYNVSLTIITSNLCFSQTSKSIYIGIPPNSPSCFLQIEFETINATSPDFNNGIAEVYGYSDIPCCYYAFWSNGEEGAVVENLSPGTYCVTLTNGENCYGTSCVTIGYNNNCTASFLIDSTTYSHLDGAYRFVNNSHGEASEYQWDFGDGTTADNYNPLHVYSDTGSYNVCLVVNTYYGCTDTICKSLFVNYIAPATANLHGIVYAGDALLPEGVAVLYEYQNDNYIAVDYSLFNNGIYCFDSLPKEKLYLTHIIPYFNLDEIYFPKYSATYFNNSTYWQQATYINLYSDTIFTTHLYRYNDIYLNDGRISGYVGYLFDQSYEENVFSREWIETSDLSDGNAANMVVLLKDNFKQILEFRLTQGNGFYDFNNLEYGFYYLSVEKPGLISDEVLIEISESNPESLNIDFLILENSITKIQDNPKICTEKIYPNPAKNYINVDTESINSSINIYNISGICVYSGLSDSNTLQIYTGDLPSGVYIVEVRSSLSCSRYKLSIE